MRGIGGIPPFSLRGVTFQNKEASYESSSVCNGQTDRGQILPAKLTAHVGWGHSRMIHSYLHRKTETHRLQFILRTFLKSCISVMCAHLEGTI